MQFPYVTKVKKYHNINYAYFFGGCFVRIVILGDSKGKKNGVNDRVVHEIMKQIKRLIPPPDYMIHLGDITAGSDNTESLRYMLEGFIRKYVENDMRKNFIPVFGNHERGENPGDNTSEIIFSEVFNEFSPDNTLEGYNKTVYYKDMDNLRLIVLNSCHFRMENEITIEQLNWLSDALSVNMDFKIVAVHIPPYPTGAHLDTSLDLYPEKRDIFWSIIDKNRVDIVFSGHEHNYSRRIINNSFSSNGFEFQNQVYQIISGGAGEKLRDKYKSKELVVVPPVAKYHYVLVDILNKKLALKAYDMEGNIIDTLSINH